MGKKKTTQCSRLAAKASKKTKATQKVQKKKAKSNQNNEGGGGQDLEQVLEEMRIKWEELHTVTEEFVEGPPSRRANATLTPCPVGNYLWLVGGEVMSDDGKAYFFNDVYRYTPEKDEWRRYTSPNCPGPRSAHAVVASATAGGVLFLFGGEFSSPSQNSFHHYRDFWAFSVTSHAWERIDTKVKPSARSGCRMAIWKHYIVLFGGFHDVGIRTTYLKDLWLFDTFHYKWQEVQFSPTARTPSARSGFSFLPTPEGIILHGGYCKEYPTSSAKGNSYSTQGIGKALDDTLLLLMDTDPKKIKWEKRKRTGYPPSPARSGCTMAYWSAKSMGVLFGGVSDQEVDEERMTSAFYNDMFGYRTEGAGRWISLPLKKAKKRSAGKKTAIHVQRASRPDGDSDDEDSIHDNSHNIPPPQDDEIDPDDPLNTVPLSRYNAMLAILRNTLYIYGGIYERGSKEFTLDDFHSISLDKLDKFTCLRKSEIDVPVGGEEESSSEEGDEDEEESSSDDDDESDEDSGSEEGDEETKQEESVKPSKSEGTKNPVETPVDLRTQAADFLKSSNDPELAAQRTAEEAISTPLPGETLAVFYARSREYWAQRAQRDADKDARGKELRRDGFGLAEQKYAEYKPMLEEVENILKEAGLDDDDLKRGLAARGAGATNNRNRR